VFRGLYRDNGYFKVFRRRNHPSIILTSQSIDLGVPLVLGRSHGKAVNITIPIEEGGASAWATPCSPSQFLKHDFRLLDFRRTSNWLSTLRPTCVPFEAVENVRFETEWDTVIADAADCGRFP